MPVRDNPTPTLEDHELRTLARELGVTEHSRTRGAPLVRMLRGS